MSYLVERRELHQGMFYRPFSQPFVLVDMVTIFLFFFVLHRFCRPEELQQSQGMIVENLLSPTVKPFNDLLFYCLLSDLSERLAATFDDKLFIYQIEINKKINGRAGFVR